MIDTTHRTDEPEIMDDFAMEGEILRDALDKIAQINRLLGGNILTLRGVEKLISDLPAKSFTIVDIGCGNGDMLRALADIAKVKGYHFKLVGIDANAFTVDHARSLSVGYDNISYRCEDIFDDSFRVMQYDVVLCTLTLHHFKDQQILELMKIFYKNAAVGIVINDLHRSAVAYYLFKALCYVFGLNAMSRDDGLISILRGFKYTDLQKYSKQLNFINYNIEWKWAFRYRWIIQKI